MIKSLALTNFKSIGKTLLADEDKISEGKLDFAPLTVFCGKNSSGKSTVLQSILLLAQTLQSNVPSQTLVLNGPIVKLGNLDDIRSIFSKSSNITIDIDFTFRDNFPFTGKIKLSECIEEDVNIEGYGILKYSLSDSLDNIKEAIIIRTGFSLDLDRVNWTKNTGLSIKVKELMNKHKAKYSITDYMQDKFRHIVINKHDGENWYYASFYEINGYILTYEETKNKDIFKSDTIVSSIKNRKKVVEDIFLSISFSNKGKNHISNIIPIINRIYIGNDSLNKTSFTATYKNKPKNITTSDNDYECYNFELDKTTEIFVKAKIRENMKLTGLKFNHFLPKNFAYLLSFYKLLSVLVLNNIFEKFTDNNYLFNNQSISDFNSAMQDIVIKMNSYSKLNFPNEKLPNPSRFNIPNNNKISDKESFLKYVNNSISQLSKAKIARFIHDRTLLHLIEQSKVPLTEFNRILLFPYTIETSELGANLQKKVEGITNYFQEKITYIGPLREEPHLQYDNFLGNISTIGTKGENCTAVLFHKKDDRVSSIDPFSFLEKELKIKYWTILDSVNNWLRYIGVAYSVTTSYKGRYGYELKVKSINSENVDNDIINVGVGISQVLPIVLVCLCAPAGTTIIIEQPELHLHPAMQSKLTDFFVATMLCNKQVIIETHSEHIINGLRLRTVNCPRVKPINNQVKIYFTENLNENTGDYKKGNTIFRLLEINEYAAMSDWPEGFFDESSKTADEIIKAVSEKWNENKDE